MYLGEKDGEFITANFYSNNDKGVDIQLSDVLNPQDNDGARIIIRPNFPWVYDY